MKLLQISAGIPADVDLSYKSYKSYNSNDTKFPCRTFYVKSQDLQFQFIFKLFLSELALVLSVTCKVHQAVRMRWEN